MKTKILLTSALLLASIMQGAVLTVSNSVANPGQYSSLPAAITAAQPGDTIYLHGTPASYGSITISKPLVIIGTGHHPRKQTPQVSILNQIDITSSDVTIDGLSFNVLLMGWIAFNNITIRNCQIANNLEIGYASPGISNMLIENNVIMNGNSYGINFNGSTVLSNVIVRNNIFHSKFMGAASAGLVIDHNFFYSTGQPDAFSGVSLATITNNIFYVMSPQGASNSTFNNNITYNTLNNTLPYGTNLGTGNLINTDPQFVNYPLAGQLFIAAHDYHLQAGSAGKNAATDGTDIGIWGGVGFSMTGEPPIPVIRLLDVNNPNVPVGGTLNVHLKSSKSSK